MVDSRLSGMPVAELAALGQLWAEFLPRLRAMVERRLDPSLAVRLDADDVMSEAFLDAHRKWAQYRASPALTPYAWLFGIVRDRLFEAWRHAHRGCRDLHRDLPWPEESSILLGLNLVSSGTSPSAAAVRDELQQRMRGTLELLRTADREILWMRHSDQLSFAEIGAVLKLSENAATVRYVRALRRLKELWEQLYGEILT